ncbi:MAG: hypothetical protein HZB67_00840 [Candidatus Aenigmarchaeota archaeon]|nr:hypothetical protein [Candidatus Aenigmarchaeota archaeon]
MNKRMTTKGRPSSKGISLPVEMIVIIAIAVLVLVVIAAFFAGGFGPPGSTITDQAALSKGCNILKLRTPDCSAQLSEIKIPGYNPTGAESMKTTGDTLKTVCDRLGYSGTNYGDCKTACGCP